MTTTHDISFFSHSEACWHQQKRPLSVRDWMWLHVNLQVTEHLHVVHQVVASVVRGCNSSIFIIYRNMQTRLQRHVDDRSGGTDTFPPKLKRVSDLLVFALKRSIRSDQHNCRSDCKKWNKQSLNLFPSTSGQSNNLFTVPKAHCCSLATAMFAVLSQTSENDVA